MNKQEQIQWLLAYGYIRAASDEDIFFKKDKLVMWNSDGTISIHFDKWEKFKHLPMELL